MNIKARVICCILYPDDNTNHKLALSTISKHYNSCYICHDKDIYLYDELDEQGNVIHHKGELKKTHYHCIITFSNARSIKAVAKELDIEENLVQKCSSFNSYVVYCTHRDEPLKHQYSASDFKGVLISKVVKALEVEDDESEQFIKIIDFIRSNNQMKFSDIGIWCASFGYYSCFRRNCNFFRVVYFETKEQKINDYYALER